MPRRNSITQAHGSLITAAFAATDLLATDSGFRLRDVQFYADLFANWLEFGKQRVGFSVQIVQLQRFIEAAVKRGEVKASVKNRATTYKFSEKGFRQLIGNLVEFQSLLRADELFFITYLLREYQEQLALRLLPEAKYHSKVEKTAVMDLIDPDGVISRQASLVNDIIKDLETRIEESNEIVDHVAHQFAAGVTNTEVIKGLDQRFSYQLSGQRSFTELFAAVPSSMLRSELKSGFARRNKLLFSKLLQYYKEQEQTLMSMQARK